MKRLIVALASCLLIFAAGCGSSESEEDPEPGNGNETEDVQDDGTMNDDDGMTEDTDNGGSAEEPKSCDDSNPPKRCSADPASFDWKPASVVSEFKVQADPVTIDGTEYDNSLGSNLRLIPNGGISNVNSSIATGIEEGSFLLLMEHDGVTELGSATTFNLNLWLGAFGEGTSSVPQEPGDSNSFQVLPTSVASGTQPQAYIPGAELGANGNVNGGNVDVPVSFTVLNIGVQTEIRNAVIGGSVNASKSALDETGVYIDDGRIAGSIPLADVYSNVNDFTGSSCDCLEGLEGDLVSYSSDNVNNASCQSQGPDYTNNCPEDGTDTEEACRQIANFCSTVTGAIEADKDTDNDGTNDSISVGATYKATGATITGVSSGGE